jgi:broad specificity phosphatase PhoE
VTATSNPAALWLLRHAESIGNVAREHAESNGLEMLDLAERDLDVPLSDLGREQAAAFGHWLGKLPDGQRPTAVLSSPHVRTEQTARIALDAAGGDLDLVLDERLRERELGVLDLLTGRGVQARFPQEAQRRSRVGKFYYRPPGGESWADVALRLRSLLDSLGRQYDGERMLLVTHEVPVLLMRFLLEAMREADVIELQRAVQLANCGLTSYEPGTEDGRLGLVDFNWTVPLQDEGAPVTEEPGVTAGSR